MAFAEGQKITAMVKLGDGKEATGQNGIVLTAEPNAKYKVFVMGLVILLDEAALAART